MSSDPAFSVILPVYNREATIDRCLRSIVGQSYAPREIIVIDDGSKDGSVAIISEWARQAPNLRLLKQKNSGVAAARNAGIAVATGDWLAFIDSDDEWQPDKLEQYVRLVRSDDRLDMIHSDRVAADGLTRALRRPDIPSHNYSDPTFLFSEWAIVTSTLCVRGETAKSAGAFIENLYSCSDYEWFWRVVGLARRIGYVPEPLTIMHDGPLGMARALPGPSRLRDNIRAMASSINWLEHRDDVEADYPVELRRWRRREFKQLIHASLGEGEYLGAAKDLAKFFLEPLTGRLLLVPVSRTIR